MELPLGFEFEESVFEGGGRGQKDSSALPPTYSARCCEPQWFCEETNFEDEAEIINVRKFKGDFAYNQQEFKALCEYSSCLALLPPSNIAMRRDIQESQARCLAHLGRHKEASEIAEMLRNGATNTDHITTVLLLQFTIHRTAGCAEKTIECLQQLISLHPFHPGHWRSLAEAYVSLLPFPLPLWGSEADLLQSDGSAVLSEPLGNRAGFQLCKKHAWKVDFCLHLPSKTNGSFGSNGEAHIGDLEKLEPKHTERNVILGTIGQEEIWIYACASFVRARLLLQLLQLHQSSFALESNLKAQQEIEEKVASFRLSRDVLFVVTEVMGEDLTPEKLKEDAQGEVKCVGASALASLMTASTAGFERKWFQKLRDELCCSDCCT
ncbi:uncharacterized protein C8orf76 homolog isoform X2 [Sphaerodactylus townsendi]|uniref:uncharacterized protein C8orf76 homolog isoform X2 n=1 Tax=Sphaerodactylus townsendi TaxID=933632 RepID=UPI002026E340|nr:uncharacterized protein C8orf76 homolog isoform X2 [Sphaerodactylus townsendi]